MEIGVIGLGFVGLTTALGFSEIGHQIVGIDLNEERINFLQNKKVPFHEPGLDTAIEKYYAKSFNAYSSYEEVKSLPSVFFVCVGTPEDAQGNADLKYIHSAVTKLIELKNGEDFLVVIKSTVPPGTVDSLRDTYASHNIRFASNPEFLREGFCWSDFLDPDRIIIGVEQKETQKQFEEIYSYFDSNCLYFMNPSSAEFSKYLSNCLLANLISFSNEMSVAALKLGNISIKEVFSTLHRDRRWLDKDSKPVKMASYVYPGFGYGGYCLPKDTKALHRRVQKTGYEMDILKNVIDVNENVRDVLTSVFFEKTQQADAVGILGLSFKPDSDDVRETPSFSFITRIIEEGYSKIYAYDPIAIDEFKKYYPELSEKINFCSSVSEVVDQSKNLVLLTAWSEFRDSADIILKKELFDFRYLIK